MGVARVFDNTPISRKLFILAAIYTVPILVLLYFLVTEINTRIDFATQELRGTEYLRVTRKLLEHVPQHRALLQGYLDGNAGLRPAVLAKQAQIGQDVAELDAVDARLGAALRSSAKEAALRAQWQELAGRSFQLKSAESDDLHGKVIAGVRDLIAAVGDSSNLILDPDLDSYYTMDNVVVKLPEEQDLIAQEVQLAQGIAARKKLTPDEKTQLVVLSVQVKSDLDTTQSEMTTAFRNNPAGNLAPALDAPTKDAVGAATAFQDLVGRRLVDAAVVDVTPDEIGTAGQRALDASFALWDRAANELDALLRARIVGFERTKYTEIGVVAAVFVIVSLLGYVISRRLSRRIGALARIADRIAAGEVDQSVEARGRDEIGALGESFSALAHALRGTLDETRLLIDAARSGQMGQRGNAEQFQGAYRELVAGMNQLLDAITAPINEAAAVLERVQAGDMTARMRGEYRGDYAKIKAALNSALENLDGGLSQVAISADQVASAANAIAAGSQSLAQGASEQASALEEVSASLQEMTSMTRRNAASSKEARSLAEGARASAERGVDSMARLSEAIERIRGSANETAKIVKTIDEIAFQTNLLALNAAVEAARAGDAGKGFAVVAEEVRSLAMRSADAAKNTANLIDVSVKNAENGVALNQEVLRNLTEIDEQVNKVREVMVEIANASDQQSQGIVQITAAVDQMNQVTQQNAANSEESAAAADELSSQANGLRGTVAMYQLSNAEVGRATQAMPAPPPRAVRVVGNGNGRRAEARRLIPFDEDERDADVLQSF